MHIWQDSSLKGTHARVYARILRCIGVMYNIVLDIRIAVSVSVAFIPYGLRTCGITILLALKGGYYGARREDKA